MEREKFIKELAKSLGFTSCGITTTEPLLEEAVHLTEWLANGYNADMLYMARNVDKRINPAQLVDGAKSIIVLTHNYYPKEELSTNAGYTIARFAYGEDYHDVLKDKMQQLVNGLEQYLGVATGYRTFVDSAPVLERALAVRSGLGWIGRNGNLIQKGKGSYFFISTIFVDIELNNEQERNRSASISDSLKVKPDFGCGKCRACIDACPNQAILSNKTIDSNKCISYLTIECKSKTANHDTLRSRNSHNGLPSVFGCDICQQVCPHNRFATAHTEPRLNPSEELQQFYTHSKWENITKEEFNIICEKSPLKRAKYAGILRNIGYM